MHLNDNTVRHVQDLPIRTHAGEVFHVSETERYDVTQAIELILKESDRFELGVIDLSTLTQQIRQRGKFNFHYIAIMKHNDARRPVLLGTLQDGSLRLLDGYHRACRSQQLGYTHVSAWILTPEQTAAIRLD